MRDTLFIWVEAYEYPSGLWDRGFSERQLLFFVENQGGAFILAFSWIKS